MKRCLVVNARTFANSAESPVLPFLAPRVFTESAVGDGRTTWLHPCLKQAKEEDDRRIQNVGCANTGPDSGGWARRRIPLAVMSSKTAMAYEHHISVFSRSTATPLTRNGKIHRLRGFSNHSCLDSRYAAISRFLRPYSQAANAGSGMLQLMAAEDAQRKMVRVPRASPPEDVWKHEERRQRIENKYCAVEKRLNDAGIDYEKRKYIANWRRLKFQMWHYSRLESKEIDPGFLAFAALDYKVHLWLREATPPVRIRHDPGCEKWMEEIRSTGTFPGNHELVASEQSVYNRKGMLFYLLEHHPLQALEFLATTDFHKWNPVFLVCSLEYLARLFTLSDVSFSSTEETKRKLVDVFCSIFEKVIVKHPYIFSQDLIRLLPRLADPGQLYSIWELLTKHNIFFNLNTFLQWAEVFGETRQPHHALAVLERFVAALPSATSSSVVNGELFASICTTILNNHMAKKSDYHNTPTVVAKFVEFGIEPNVIHNNVIMHLAVEANDLKTAFRVYSTLIKSGKEPNAHTYSILLTGCARAHSPQMFEEFAEDCRLKAHDLKNPVIASNYLQYMYRLVSSYNRSKERRYHDLPRRAYDQFFAFEPLGKLIPTYASLAPNGPEPRLGLDPSPQALLIMIAREIRLVSFSNPARVVELYKHFRTVTRDPETCARFPAIATLGRTTPAYNAFIKAFCDRKQFASASDVIRDMTESKDPDVPKPGVIAWTCFMQAFFQNDQVAVAERVLDIMRQRGVAPDEVTWRILLGEYAKRQMVDRMVESGALEHFRDRDEIDPWLLKKLARVHDKKLLALEMAKWEEKDKEWMQIWGNNFG